MKADWLQTATLTLLATLAAVWDQCPGLIKHPEPRHEAWNIKFAKELAEEVREADSGKGFELIFYGDSITEQWRGTDQGGVCTRCIGDTVIFNQYFGRKYRSEVLAVGGDQISHLQWRLLHGDIPAVHHPKAAVVLIGINDLGAAADCSQGNPDIITHAAKGVISRLKETIKLLKAQLPETQLVMLALLPRGDGSDASTTFQWPGRYTPAIQTVNAWLEDTAAEDEGITFLDCGDQLLQDGQIVPEIQVDGLHPSAAGMEIMAQCISPVVDDIMGYAASDSWFTQWLPQIRLTA